MKSAFFNTLLVSVTIGLVAGCASTSDPMAKSADTAATAGSAMASGGMDTSSAMDKAMDATTGGAAMAAPSGVGLTDTLVQQLGVTPAQASGGAGAIFGAAQTNMSPGDFAQVSDAVPEMDSLLGAAPSMGGAAALGGAGALGGGVPGLDSGGGMAGMAAGAGALGGLAGPFGDLGMSPDMVGKFVPVIMDYVQAGGGASTASLLQGALF
jgi:hypothetical protein